MSAKPSPQTATHRGADDAATTAVEDMRIDHRRRHIRVAEQLLHGTDIVASLEEMRGEGVTQRVRRGRLGQARVA